MKKIFSVIVTTYNSEKSIERTLKSIFNQNGIREEFDIELILVDDCSNDKTVEIVKKYETILLSTKKNTGGPNAGRNIGLKAASGDYICISDHDDEWKENKLITQLPYLEKVPIVTSGYTVIDSVSGKVHDRLKKSKDGFIYYEKNKAFLKKLSRSLKGQTAYLGNTIYSKELKNILFEENFGMTDFDWALRLYNERDSIEVCESLFNRYVSKTNLSLNENYRIKDFYYSLMTIEQYMNNYPREVKIAYKKIHGSRARYYYLTGNMKKARFFFKRSKFNFITLAYYITSFWGSEYVKKRFKVF